MQETKETRVLSLGHEDPLEEEMATHPSICAWDLPRVPHDWAQRSNGAYYLGSASQTLLLSYEQETS